MIDLLIQVVDDEPEIRIVLKDLLESNGYDVIVAENGLEAIQLYKEHLPGIILSDIKMPDITGIELLKQIKSVNPEAVVILMTGHSSIENAVEAIKSGAEDYLLKPLDYYDILNKINHICKRQELKINNEILRQEMLRHKTVQIVGKSRSILKVKKEIRQVAGSDIPVLIMGDTGTGKELVARAIHDQSARKNQPYVAINCAAIPSDLLESELFGHERGAFSGAVARKYGLFEVADKGTILLDEIGEMSVELQSKILRTIETKQFRRLGAGKEVVSDFRVISSTNRNLKQMITEGKFREDLFYRLTPFIIEVPPLRDRKSDIPLLVDFFSVKKGRHDASSEKQSEFIEALKSYPWPGNIRELQNALERVFLLAGDRVPSVNHLPPEIQNIYYRQDNMLKYGSGTPTLSEIERNYILKLYHELGDNKTLTAEKLGISLRSLYNRLKQYDILN